MGLFYSMTVQSTIHAYTVHKVKKKLLYPWDSEESINLFFFFNCRDIYLKLIIDTLILRLK